ncbi:hypothetical protein [Pseudoalteromonas sp. Of7M-16]|uniref:hypothetical protein n=1 Tax=Pseudoalteromonas sp. Of7M-16 TaxID=2917756 RepID=UPI001EF674F2|nr:hypothetical protein [Pseudoalteromonas sp. Of7M-16]MCG7551568.1 hypothetical protein [Pseudoalteromonas sp. Of7M-16]
MTKGIHLDDYHKGVSQWLLSNIHWLKSVECYPESGGAIDVPCGLFAISGWQPADHHPGNGQLSLTLHCEILIAFSVEYSTHQLDVRNAAMALSIEVDNNSFDIPGVKPARLIGASPDALHPELDDYAVWSVQFVQSVTVGKSEFEPEEYRAGIRLAVDPVDVDNSSEYNPLEVSNASAN